MVELASCAYFQNYIDVCGIVEATIHLDDVGVVEKHLDLHLSYELICDFLLVQKLLLDYLQSADEVGVPLTNQVHSAILTISQLFYLHKIINTHLSWSFRKFPQANHPPTTIIIKS